MILLKPSEASINEDFVNIPIVEWYFSVFDWIIIAYVAANLADLEVNTLRPKQK